MKRYICDNPDCKESTDYDIKDGWMKMKLSCYCDNSLHTGWLDREVQYYCPKCSKAILEFLRGDKDVPSIDFRKLAGDKTVTKTERKDHYDKGYIWE